MPNNGNQDSNDDEDKLFQPYLQPKLLEILNVGNFYTPRAGIQPAQKLSSDFAEGRSAVVITTNSWWSFNKGYNKKFLLPFHRITQNLWNNNLFSMTQS